MTPTRSLLLLLASATVACSDKGALKPEAAARPADPPLVSARGEAAGSLPPGHPPVGSGSPASSLPAVPEGAGVGEQGLAWTVPAGWISQTPASPLRRAQYRVPGSGGDGECVVFYFGPGQGGDPATNASRWAGQFKRPDGSSAESVMKTSTIDVGGIQVLLVDVAGTYSGGMTMTSEPPKPMPGYRLLGAIASGPDANWFFKLTGPDATVGAQRASFEGMVRSLKHGA